jgi:hypothetical protein
MFTIGCNTRQIKRVFSFSPTVYLDKNASRLANMVDNSRFRWYADTSKSSNWTKQVGAISFQAVDDGITALVEGRYDAVSVDLEEMSDIDKIMFNHFKATNELNAKAGVPFRVEIPATRYHDSTDQSNNVMDLLDSSCTRGFFDLTDKDKPKADQQPLQV